MSTKDLTPYTGGDIPDAPLGFGPPPYQSLGIIFIVLVCLVLFAKWRKYL